MFVSLCLVLREENKNYYHFLQINHDWNMIMIDDYYSSFAGRSQVSWCQLQQRMQQDDGDSVSTKVQPLWSLHQWLQGKELFTEYVISFHFPPPGANYYGWCSEAKNCLNLSKKLFSLKNFIGLLPKPTNTSWKYDRPIIEPSNPKMAEKVMTS